jgi:hypothetical protein
MADHAATNSGLVQLTDEQYNLIRFFIEKVLPAAGAFYALLGGYWGWDNIVQVTGSLAGAAVFLGVIMSFARKGYTQNPEVPPGGFDGEIVAGDPKAGEPVLTFKLDPTKVDDLFNKKVVTFKGFDPTA